MPAIRSTFILSVTGDNGKTQIVEPLHTYRVEQFIIINSEYSIFKSTIHATPRSAREPETQVVQIVYIPYDI